MTRFRKILFAAALSAFAAAPAGAQEAKTVIETHGDWEIQCSPDKTLCTMNQTFSDAEGRPFALLSFARLKDRTTPNGATIPAQMEVRVPLGVLLTEGLSIQVDSGKKEVAPYSFCTKGGCRVLVPIPDSFIATLKAGAGAKIVFKTIDGQSQSATMSLKGFTKAYNALTPLS